MKEFFKNKKVIITGHDGFKRLWLQDLLNEWEAHLIDTSSIQSHLDVAEHFTNNKPEIVFHISSHNPEQTKLLSPYISTSHILDVIKSTPSIKSAIVIPAKKSEEAKEWQTGLDEDEKKELARLLEKVDNVQIRGEIWHQLVKKFITVPIELCIVDSNNKVFMVYRKDREFDGYHIPGTVINDWETVDQACARLVNGEVLRDAGFSITKPESVGWLEVRRGEGAEESKTRNAISLLYLARLDGAYEEKEGMAFFDFNSLPENTLGHHKFILRRFNQYLTDGEIVLGK
jgi:ADP-ribose pyrophosphatase YjhB (NUDIX family)